MFLFTLLRHLILCYMLLTKWAVEPCGFIYLLYGTTNIASIYLFNFLYYEKYRGKKCHLQWADKLDRNYKVQVVNKSNQSSSLQASSCFLQHPMQQQLPPSSSMACTAPPTPWATPPHSATPGPSRGRGQQVQLQGTRSPHDYTQ